MWTPSRRGQVLPFTLTEIFVLLVFLLLLLFASTIFGLDEETIEECANLPEDEVCIPIKNEDLPKEGQRPAGVDSSAKLDSTEIFVPMDTSVSKLFYCDPSKGKCENPGKLEEALKCALDSEPGQECQPVSDNDTTIRKVDAGIFGGMDSLGIPPPRWREFINFKPGACWKENDHPYGATIYAFEVDMEPDRLTITPIWPEAFNDRAIEVDGLVALSEVGTIDIATYDQMGPPILAWSRRQRPECRHYVKIFFSGVAFKFEERGDELRVQEIVEKYFYKQGNAILREIGDGG